MKRMKKLASLLLAMVMVLSMTVAAFADNLNNVNTETTPNTTAHDIIIKNVNKGHTYEAYQVFRGDYYDGGEEKLSNITWGTGVNGSSLLAALKEDSEMSVYFSSCKTAEDVAKVLATTMIPKTDENGNIVTDEDNKVQYTDKKYFDVADNMDKFAKVVGKNLTSTKATNNGSVSITEMVDEKEVKKEQYTIPVVGDGYYLVQDSASSKLDKDAFTRYIMQVVGTVNIDAKAETPTIEKKIMDGGDRVDANTAGINQIVSYEVTGNVPNYTGYEYYYYIVNDTLSSGLTFNDDVVVTVGDATLVKDTDFYVTRDNNTNSFKVSFENIMNYAIDALISVKYSATVNENAVIGGDGNTNTVKLSYSHNPNNSSRGDEGDKGIPTDPTVLGESPEDVTVTYVAKVEITKTQNGTTTPLAGAEFTITGTSEQTLLTDKVYYIKEADYNAIAEDERPERVDEKTYYLLKNANDGESYTTTMPQGEHEDEETKETVNSNLHLYADTVTKYYKVKTSEITKVTVDVAMSGISGKDGIITFERLGAGTYKIVETGVPEGYNKAEDVNFDIGFTFNVDDNGKITPVWSVTNKNKDDNDNVVDIVSLKSTTSKDAEGKDVTIAGSVTAIYGMTITNMSGALLPSTGGIGRTIFYAAGIILMAGAMFFVVRRKRA